MSEFGSGIAVCLAKFSEHLWNRTDPGMNPQDDRLKWSIDFERKYRPDESEEQHEARAHSELLHLWANAASDHFYDLDRDKAPAPLVELADLTLEIGHGFGDRIWTSSDYRRIRELWKQSCLALDEMLGVAAEWGEY